MRSGEQPQRQAPTVRRITPVEVQQKEFRLAFRGYNEADVDQFLDEVTEELARLHEENKRLREQLEFQGTGPIDAAAATEAEDILRRAREEAARIVSEAEAKATVPRGDPEGSAVAGDSAEERGGAAPVRGEGGVSGVPDRSPLRPFLARERQFLQSLAAIIQGHADAVREDVRSLRSAEQAATGPMPVAEDRPRESPPETPPNPEGNAPADRGSAAPTHSPLGAGEEAVARPSDTGPAPGPPIETGAAAERMDRTPTPDWPAGTVRSASAPRLRRQNPSGDAPSRPATQPPEPETVTDDGPEERSVRELFWGEQ